MAGGYEASSHSATSKRWSGSDQLTVYALQASSRSSTTSTTTIDAASDKEVIVVADERDSQYDCSRGTISSWTFDEWKWCIHRTQREERLRTPREAQKHHVADAGAHLRSLGEFAPAQSPATMLILVLASLLIGSSIGFYCASRGSSKEVSFSRHIDQSSLRSKVFKEGASMCCCCPRLKALAHGFDRIQEEDESNDEDEDYRILGATRAALPDVQWSRNSRDAAALSTPPLPTSSSSKYKAVEIKR